MTVATCPAEEAVAGLKDEIGTMILLEGSGRKVFLHISEPVICTICNEQHPVVFVESVRGSDMKGAVCA